MNKEQIKKMIADDFDNLIKERLDGAIIFKYISNLEKENLKLKEQLQQKEDIINKIKKYLRENEKEYGSLEDNEKIILRILDNKGE